MKQRKLERKLIDERKSRKLDESDRKLDGENRTLETVRKLDSTEDIRLEVSQSNKIKDKIRKLESRKEHTDRKLEIKPKLDGDCILERKLEIDNNTECIEKIRHRISNSIQEKIKPSILSPKVVKIRSQIEEKIRKQNRIERKLSQNSPISKRKYVEENKRKLDSSIKKIVQSKKQKGKGKYPIPTSQRSIWEFWGTKDEKKDT